VLADGWTYANWVVGTARIRDVDLSWPEASTHIHHSFGVWPIMLSDSTRVEAVEPGRELVLTARGWPLGESRVHLSVRPDGESRSVVTLTEDAVSGPATVVPPVIRHVLFAPRNRETLRRLALIAEGRRRHAQH